MFPKRLLFRRKILCACVRSLALVVAVMALSLLPLNVLAQNAKKTAAKKTAAKKAGAKKAVAKNDKQDEQPLPEPREIDLKTKDRVLLKANYYPGTRGKESVPIILLHSFKGNRGDFEKLALFLQKQGHAVIAPDLRGHGDSTKIEGSKRELNVNRFFPRGSFKRMVEFDVNSVKRFLMKENNNQKLNIQKLCLIGSEMGASIALRFAALDWSWRDIGEIKQGRDVRALVLISPKLNFKGIDVQKILKVPPLSNLLSVQIVVGRNKLPALRDAKQIEKYLMRSRPKPDPEKSETHTVFIEDLQTSLQGMNLLGVRDKVPVEKRIAGFIKWRLTKQNDEEYQWAVRKKKNP